MCVLQKVISRLDFWMFESFRTQTADLALYRIIYALWMLKDIPMHMWLVQTPRAFFNPPPGIPGLFMGLPDPWAVTLVNVIYAFALVALLLGWHTEIASIASAVCLLLLNTWAYSLGKINHDILSLAIPFILAFSGWGNAYSVDALMRGKNRRELTDTSGSWTVALLACVIALAMFSAGWAKLTTGWLDTSSHSVFGYLVSNYYAVSRHTLLGGILIKLDSPLFWEALDWFTVALEVGFLVSVINYRLFRIFCALASVFHLGVLLLFNISFDSNVIAYAVVIPYWKIAMSVKAATYEYVGQTSMKLFKIPGKRVFATVVLFSIAILGLDILVLRQSFLSYFRLPASEVTVMFGAAVGIAYLLYMASRAFHDVVTIGR